MLSHGKAMAEGFVEGFVMSYPARLRQTLRPDRGADGEIISLRLGLSIAEAVTLPLSVIPTR